jgi:hypothetical protein
LSATRSPRYAARQCPEAERFPRMAGQISRRRPELQVPLPIGSVLPFNGGRQCRARRPDA